MYSSHLRNNSTFSPSSTQTPASKRIFSGEQQFHKPRYTRQSSNDSKSSNEWVNYRVGLDGWTNIPRFQSSKFVTEINHGAADKANTFSDSRSSSDDKTPSPTSGCNSAQGVYKVTTFEVLPCNNKVKVEKNDTIESNNIESTSESEYCNEAVIKHEPSSAIITETITTGSNHRFLLHYYLIFYYSYANDFFFI